MLKNTKNFIYNNQYKNQRFEERLQVLSKAWLSKWIDPMYHSSKLLSGYASGYFDRTQARQHIINLLDRGVNTFVPYLVEGNPKVMVESLVANMRSSAYRTQVAMNFLIEKMNMAESVFIPAAVYSMFGGVATRTMSEYDRLISLDDKQIKLGSPKVVVIDPADYIGDPAAKYRDDFVIEGDMYRLPVEYAKDIFPKYADNIYASEKLVTRFSAEEIAQGKVKWSQLNLREYATFIDLYIRDEGIIITIMPYGNKPVALKTIKHDGPGDGPYDYLGYKYFPGCPIPIPPAWAWNDLDDAINRSAAKAVEQAEAQKDILIAEPVSKSAAEKIIKASNENVIVTKNSKGVQKISFGGVNPDNYNWMNFAKTEWSESGPNPDVLRGASTNAGTFGQEKMLFRNATRIVNNFHTRFENFMTSILNKLAWQVWTDPTVYIPVIEKIPGFGEVPIIFSQADKVGDFYDFVFKIKEYSSQRTPPELQYQRMMQFLTSWVLPTAQIAAQQGASIDIPLATQILADYAGFDTFNQIYKTTIPSELEGISYAMQPIKNSGGQMNDSMGATQPSREANLQQQQSRTSEENI